MSKLFLLGLLCFLFLATSVLANKKTEQSVLHPEGGGHGEGGGGHGGKSVEGASEGKSEEGGEPEEEGEGHITYTMEHELLAVSLIILALILLSLGIEICTEALEEFLKKKHVEEMLFKMYKELMILGICGLMLFVEEKYHFLEKGLGEFDKHIFEHVHMTLFMVVVCYIIVTCVLMGYSIWVANHYKEIEHEAKTEDGKREILSTWNKFERQGKEQGICGHIFSVRWNYQYNQAYLRYQYVELRRQFIEQHKAEFPEMEQEGFFEFYVYLRKCVRQACIGIAMIHWQVWLTILLIVFLNTIRIVLWQTSEVSSFVIVDSIVLWAVTFYIFYLRYKTLSTIKTLTHEYEEYSKLNHGDHVSEHEEHEEEEADEEEAKHHEDERIMAGGPGCCGKRGCGKKDAHPQQKLFPCHKPATTSRGIQLCLLLISISIPLYLMELSETIVDKEGFVKVIISCCIGIPPVLCLFLGIPPIIPRFVICSSVASMSRPTMIRDTIKKLKREAAYLKKHGHTEKEEKGGCCGPRKKEGHGHEGHKKHSHKAGKGKEESKSKHHHEEDEEEKGLTSED